MQHFYIYILAFVFGLNIHAQTSEKANNILAKASANIKSYQCIKLKFTFTHENMRDETVDNQNGTLLLKGNKYFISMPQTDIYYNGKTMWNYLKNANEVNVIKPESDTTSGALDFTNPKQLFTIEEEDYKSRYVEKISKDGKTYHQIDLYPRNLDLDYHRIRILIDKDAKLIQYVKVFSKQGEHFTFEVSDFNTDINVSDKEFTFDKSKHPDVEVIDMRF
jgi:outer membrane lipoprotein-sorting protein